MATASPPRASRRPALHISESDYDRISELALRLEKRSPELSQLVFGEIDRARLHRDAKLPANVVCLGAEVEFADDSNRETRTVTLVLPGEADIEAGRVSVLTPVGAGLIGLSEGQEILWPCADGRPRTLRIVRVRQPERSAPEAA